MDITAHFLKDISETGYHLGDSVSQKNPKCQNKNVFSFVYRAL